MLEKLLAELRSGGTFETGKLASRLGTSPEMIRAMLEQLQRAGYLQSYRSCGQACGGCSLRPDCGQPSSGQEVLRFMLSGPPAPDRETRQ